MDLSECDATVDRLLAGRAGPGDALRLREACAADPALLERCARLLEIERLLGAMLAGTDGDARFAAEAIARIGAAGPDTSAGFAREVSRRIAVRSRRRMRLAAAIALLLAVMAGAAFLRSAQRPRAVLVRAEAAVWDPASPPTGSGQAVATGRPMTLRAGLVELDFGSSVQVLVEGPATFKVTGPDSMWLERGRIFADVVKPEGKGFTVDGPGGRVIDLGTRFGVAAGPGGEMEVHVLQGKVEALPAQSGGPVVSLGQDEGLRIDRRAVARIPADESGFLTSLPPATIRDAGYILWKFDEASGPLCLNSGRGLGPADSAARMLGGSPPARVSGPRGRALAFDGIGSYLDTPFKGIPGSGARTIAMWARVPEDLKITESYAMIAWGDVSGEGTAWQISVNPDPAEGTLGGLRAGTGRGAVVGSTDLRDGRWHHLAVVMYGGPAASTATHVLLYVDGELEPTTRKSIREISTDIDSVNHGIWIGRNLSVAAPDPPGARYFRGEIDEILLMDTALDRQSIRGFMK